MMRRALFIDDPQLMRFRVTPEVGGYRAGTVTGNLHFSIRGHRGERAWSGGVLTCLQGSRRIAIRLFILGQRRDRIGS